MIAARHTLRAKAISATLLAAALISACGGSSSTGSTAANGAATSAGKSTATGASRDLVTKGAIVHKPLHGTGGDEINDDNPGVADAGKNPAAGQNDPCALVSRAQAETILHTAVNSPEEAPLGPTCIYQPTGAKTLVTLSLEAMSVANIRSAIHHRERFKIGGRTAYCGDYGQPTTLVPLSDGKVLDITAPCKIGRQFAAKAVSSSHA